MYHVSRILYIRYTTFKESMIQTFLHIYKKNFHDCLDGLKKGCTFALANEKYDLLVKAGCFFHSLFIRETFFERFT